MIMTIQDKINAREIKGEMPGGLSFFTLSSRLWRDWVKLKQLCVLCVSVVNNNSDSLSDVTVYF